MEALLLIDIQNDFLPGGALGVADGDKVVPVANRLMQHFDLVVATLDWHPAGHESFAAEHAGREVGDLIHLHGLAQILWPVHCVQNTPGSDFATGLNRAGIHKIVTKGTNTTVDSYSGFFDNGRKHETELDAYLKKQGVTSLFVLGLATDYCVKFSVNDACSLGYETWVVRDGCRAVNLSEGDEERAIASMQRAGARVITSRELLARDSEAAIA